MSGCVCVTCACGMAVLLTVISVIFVYVEGICVGTHCSNITEIQKNITNGIQDTVNIVEKEGQALVQDAKEIVPVCSEKCECVGYNCGCCAHIEEPLIELNSTICANASYLVHDYGISLTVTVNHYTIFNETVSVRNPPPVCLGVPYVKEWAEACVRLHDIDATKSHLHACVCVEARMKKVVIAKYELGCFDMGPRISNELDNDIAQQQYPSVVMV